MRITENSSSVVPFIQAARGVINGSGSIAEPPAVKLTYFADCGAFIQKDWIIKGVIAKGETSGWIAPPGHGKSALLIEIGVHCAAGRDWRGHKAKAPCGVVILALERADLCKRRLHAYAVRDELIDLPIAVHAGIIDLMNPASVSAIVEIVRTAERGFGVDVGMIIIDTFSKAIAAGGGDEDRARDQNRVAANLRRVQELLGIHIALVGHTGKDETRGARGSNAHLGDVDFMVQISGDAIKSAEIVKANDQAEGVLAQFRLEPIDLGTDSDGDKISTAIVSIDPIDAPAATKTREPKLSPDQKTMLRLLHEAKPAGLSTADWNDKGRAVGVGRTRRATLNDIQARLKELSLVREYSGQWTAVTRL
ncbi:AAA family ATPase [Bradyrhizobium cosmicum]|uniref:AAA family ATPase n=1 Tax=Bradyrhizobium cosmicum TaxID=1404864 RepID=UPI0028E43173|nr:AAA family ATPase [Bradyrhizobium cosmicum]